MFAHQQAVFDAVTSGNHCLVSTGTGSGKTEAFLYPILDHCFMLRDANADPWIVVILVYSSTARLSSAAPVMGIGDNAKFKPPVPESRERLNDMRSGFDRSNLFIIVE